MKISREEFRRRIERIQAELEKENLDAAAVYGDEYRRESLRYVTNFWPIFERGMLFIPRCGEPVFAGAPEGEQYATEQCVWPDIRNVREFACVSVPETIDYPLAKFSSFREILAQVMPRGGRLGLVGTFDLPGPIFQRLDAAFEGEIVPADGLMTRMRLRKSPDEIACLRKAGEIACIAYRALLAAASPGKTELFAAGAAEGAARQAGAEAIAFTVFGSGQRAATIIGRPTEKVIESGDMVMAALAVQYAGYISTVEYPFVAGEATPEQKAFLGALFDAANAQYSVLRPGLKAADMVRTVKQVFARHGLSQYDVYPPMHGIGLAEGADYAFEVGMCVNSDISLFGHPHGSNRIEEGFVFTENGVESLTPLIRELVAKGLER